MTLSKRLAVAGLLTALSATPYTFTGAGLITKQAACASGGTCTDAGCIGGTADCFRTSTGTCTTTIRTPPAPN